MVLGTGGFSQPVSKMAFHCHFPLAFPSRLIDYLGLYPPLFSLQEIDQFIVQAKERGYETLVSFGKRSLNVAATAAVQAAAKVTLFLLDSVK